MTKIDIISGFLGAGKTTLIQLLLNEALLGEQVVLIENEFGEIGIDSGFLKNSGIEIKEMNSGCICCSLVGDFRTSLQEVIDQYHPDRIVIEPSGVGKLSDVIVAVKEVCVDGEVELHGLTTVVDVGKCKMYLRNVGEFYGDQLVNAQTIILSRTDKVERGKIEQVTEIIREYNKNANIVTTPITELGGEKLMRVLEGGVEMLADVLREEHHHGEGCGCGEHGHDHHEEGYGCGEHGHDHHEEGCGCGEHGHDHHKEGCGCGEHGHDHHKEGCGCGEHEHDHHEEGCSCGEHGHDENCSCGDHDHHHGHHHADEVFSSWGKETVKSFAKEELETILSDLSNQDDYGMVFRAKGMVSGTEGGWHYFDMVPGEFEVRSGSPDFTGRLCVIGSKLNDAKLGSLFGI